MNKNRIGKEIHKIFKGGSPNLKLYERYKKRILKKIERYQKEKDRLINESKGIEKTDSNEYRAYSNGIILMGAIIEDLNNLLGYDVKRFFMRLYHSPWLI